MSRVLGMLLLVVFASWARAQVEADAPEALPEPALVSAAKQKFAEKIQVLRGKYAADQTSAKQELLAKYDDLLKLEKAKGRLQQLLDLQKNRELLAANQPLTNTLQPGETTAHTAYENKLKAAFTSYEKVAKLATNEFLANLDAGIREETKADRIEVAVEIRKIREHYETLGVPSAIAAMAKPPAKSESTTPLITPGAAAPNPFAHRAEAFKALEGESPLELPQAEPLPRVATTTPPVTTTAKSPTTANVPAKQPPAKVLPPNADWAKVMANPAVITVKGQEPIALDPDLEGQTFKEIPRMLAKRATIYSKQKDKHNGVSDITVDKDGFLLLACNYKNEGNSNGGWQETRWLPERFEKEGWKKLSAQDLGGNLGETTIFLKYVRAGEELKLRSNKYSAPKAIVFDSPAGK
jgi:hypothetical protein